jgi:hypothetical protein
MIQRLSTGNDQVSHYMCVLYERYILQIFAALLLGNWTICF